MEIERPTSSALIRRLRDAARARPRSIGFGRDRDGAAGPAVVVVASVRGYDAAAAKKAVADGAAAVLFEGGEVGKDAREAAAACGDVAAGVALGQVAVAPSDLERSGFDYVLVDVERAPAAVLAAEGVARVARVADASQSTGLLRALGELQVDAVLAARLRDGSASLTILDLMGFRHVVDCMRQPVLVEADANLQPESLQALRDVGVVGVVVSDLARIGAFASAATTVKATRAAGASGGMAVLPRLSTPRSSGGDGEQEDDDDE
jgi:hypothetical protein